ncbi:hypothetical protein MRB53_036323 [Persea americana]|nr:hypothetical protein MRB53_042409 [Persea americana]KAJ8609165.1 hypothetical protein MRB53_039280 [Persea americana]KAJ8614752.1 hypothetical protein MRB53_036418 [Persea americana]KAJ8614910.1 hypothetical protein MRB53_036323 [Persea americana]
MMDSLLSIDQCPELLSSDPIRYILHSPNLTNHWIRRSRSMRKMNLTEQVEVLLLVQLEHKAEKREVQKLKELRQLSVLPEQPTQLFFMPKFLQM